MLEMNTQNVTEIANLSDSDMKIRNKWLTKNGAKVVLKVPQTYEDLQRFIRDWTSVCPRGTNSKLQEYEKQIRKEAKQKNIAIQEFHVALLVSRKVARIKRDYSTEQDDLVGRVANKYKKSKQGYTYLSEIVYMLTTYLNVSGQDYPRLISAFEGTNTRRTV